VDLRFDGSLVVFRHKHRRPCEVSCLSSSQGVAGAASDQQAAYALLSCHPSQKLAFFSRAELRDQCSDLPLRESGVRHRLRVREAVRDDPLRIALNEVKGLGRGPQLLRLRSGRQEPLRLRSRLLASLRMTN
jgi:hypothetical protein